MNSSDLQRLDHADVGGAPSASAPKYQPNTGASQHPRQAGEVRVHVHWLRQHFAMVVVELPNE